MDRIFISYASDGRTYARRLKKALQDLGDAAFLEEDELAAGHNFTDRIRTNLQSADYLVALLTKRAVASAWVSIEIGAVWGLGKRIVPVLLADLDIDKLDFLGRDPDMLDARNLKPEQAAQRIRALADEVQ